MAVQRRFARSSRIPDSPPLSPRSCTPRLQRRRRRHVAGLLVAAKVGYEARTGSATLSYRGCGCRGLSLSISFSPHQGAGVPIAGSHRKGGPSGRTLDDRAIIQETRRPCATWSPRSNMARAHPKVRSSGAAALANVGACGTEFGHYTFERHPVDPKIQATRPRFELRSFRYGAVF
ncbi:uncharacterized protein LY79DRAFT_338077 [Colletotrichum navitas]|uniref:Uncharacterized protein n=1 Tax=Colletotrichum navitas TaxID=681940 RepID=A0AAD8V129_9PEZI|nr:uncharacterized protein LY79DRAFT_338077 [Colletotrichum navitas]KAK1579591.1 hypothetical protein LY79DRAFT_338077 [Colletotrichum navitas]